jgi:transposase
MRPQRPIDDKAKVALAQLLKEVKNKSDYQRVQCVWLRAVLGLNHKEVAQVIGWSESRIKQVWSDYFKYGEDGLVGLGRGGRHHENLSIEEEKTLLSGFVSDASTGGILVVDQVHAAYEQEVGRSVPKSTVYRMLARHGWRKIMPRPRHPQNDPQKAESFKRNSETLSGKKLRAKEK